MTFEANNRLLRAARGVGLSVVLVHECDPARGGCEFGHFFQTTPQDLISDGLYARVAVAFQVGQHRTVSLCLLAREVGAVRYHKKGALWSRGGRQSTKLMAALLLFTYMHQLLQPAITIAPIRKK